MRRVFFVFRTDCKDLSAYIPYPKCINSNIFALVSLCKAHSAFVVVKRLFSI